MGNEQSGSNNGGISTSLSFLAGRKGASSVKKKTGQIVVVRPGSNNSPNPEDDYLLKRFKEIPKFYPVLRSALHQPGLHDSSDLKKKMSSRPILRLTLCLQDHFEQCARLVANEQEYIGAKIKDVDYYIVTLLNKVIGRRKNVELFLHQLEKVRDINTELEIVKARLADMVPQVEKLNELLPESTRLLPLNIGHVLEHTPTSSVSTFSSEVISNTSQSSSLGEADSLNYSHIEPIEELAVVDKVFK